MGSDERVAAASLQLALPYPVTVAPAGVYVVRHPRARHYRLRVDGAGRVRVTIPRGGSRREADRFASAHEPWIRRQRARVFGGPRLTAGERARLRRQAAEELPRRLAELAAGQGVRPAHVSVGDQRTRWGSCSRAGRIRLNWRLVLMPGWVRDYVLIHELMHVRHLDHGPAFWGLVEAACPAWREASRWLRWDGEGLKSV